MNKFEKMLKEEQKKFIWTGYVTYYPHKRAYKENELDMVKVWQNEDKINLYVHIPFCEKKCAYCNLFSTVMGGDIALIYEKYVDKLLNEIEYYSQFINSDAKVMSLYFGGGTPNILSYFQIEKIVNKFKEKFTNWDSGAYMCMECNPTLLTKEYISYIRKIGFKRISVGVQSFNKNELKIINRSDNVEIISNIKSWCNEFDIEFNLDLIYGLPYQTKESIFDNIKKAISFSPSNICVYPLAICKQTAVYNMDRTKMFTMKQKYKIYTKIRKFLEKNGYKCQTIVRFVKNDAKTTYQQQQLEYQGIATLGVGAGARSYTNECSYCLTYKVQDNLVKSIIEEYLTENIKDIKLTSFSYNKDEQKRKFIMLSMLDPGISEQDYKNKFNSEIFDDFSDELIALKKQKMISYDKAKKLFVLTKKGRQFCDICADVFVSENVRKIYKEYIVE